MIQNRLTIHNKRSDWSEVWEAAKSLGVGVLAAALATGACTVESGWWLTACAVVRPLIASAFLASLLSNRLALPIAEGQGQRQDGEPEPECVPVPDPLFHGAAC